MRCHRAVLCGLLGLLTWAAPAWGQGACSLAASAVQFGGYDGGLATPLDTVANVEVRCPPGVPYRLVAGSGDSAAGASSQRHMRAVSGQGRLAYNLYLDAAHTRVWGDDTNASFAIAGVGSGGPTRFQIFGRIPAQQNVAAGAYRDVIVVTLIW